VDLKLFGEVFITLFVIMDPPGTIPVFLSLASGQPSKMRRRMAWQAVTVAFVVIVVFAAFGQQILGDPWPLGLAQGGVKVCYGTDEAAARRTAHRLWANSGVPGELTQVLRTPEHFMQVSELVTEEMTGESVVCGPDVDAHVQALQEYVDAGYDEVYVGQMGDEQQPFFDFYQSEVLPRFTGRD